MKGYTELDGEVPHPAHSWKETKKSMVQTVLMFRRRCSLYTIMSITKRELIEPSNFIITNLP